MKQFRNYMWTLLSVLLLTGAACSRQGAQSAATQTAAPERAPAEARNPDSCALVTKDEVHQVVGQDVEDPKPNPGNAAICDFKFGSFGLASFLIQHPGPEETPDKIIEEFRKRNIQVTEAGGVGDRSFFVNHGYGMTQLNSFKGQSYAILTLLIPGTTEDKQKAAAEELMRKALSRI